MNVDDKYVDGITYETFLTQKINLEFCEAQLKQLHEENEKLRKEVNDLHAIGKRTVKSLKDRCNDILCWPAEKLETTNICTVMDHVLSAYNDLKKECSAVTVRGMLINSWTKVDCGTLRGAVNELVEMTNRLKNQVEHIEVGTVSDWKRQISEVTGLDYSTISIAVDDICRRYKALSDDCLGDCIIDMRKQIDDTLDAEHVDLRSAVNDMVSRYQCERVDKDAWKKVAKDRDAINKKLKDENSAMLDKINDTLHCAPYTYLEAAVEDLIGRYEHCGRMIRWNEQRINSVLGHDYSSLNTAIDHLLNKYGKLEKDSKDVAKAYYDWATHLRTFINDCVVAGNAGGNFDSALAALIQDVKEGDE